MRYAVRGVEKEFGPAGEREAGEKRCICMAVLGPRIYVLPTLQ